MTEALAPLAPLKVTCTTSDCTDNLHCFKFHSRKMTESQRGSCRACGVSLVNWQRVHARDRDDLPHTVEALKKEFIRHWFWHVDIDDKAKNHARRKGRVRLRTAALQRIANSVGPAEPSRDGRQTPMRDNVLYYAQHAMACCCRTCIEYWHDIPKGRPLTPEELAYFTELVMSYVGQRMPDLPDEAKHVPRRSHNAPAA
jgi:hypothetical protein